jgi:hypothetical protein
LFPETDIRSAKLNLKGEKEGREVIIKCKNINENNNNGDNKLEDKPTPTKAVIRYERLISLFAYEVNRFLVESKM